MTTKNIKPDNDLHPELRRVARECGTEAPFSGEHINNTDDGTYVCAVCGTPLFSSEVKFDSRTGWPSFSKPMDQNNVELLEDRTHEMERTEVRCKRCGAHLGHVFNDGPKETGGARYCINSVCLEFEDYLDNEY